MICVKFHQAGMMPSQNLLNVISRRVAAPYPDHFRRIAVNQPALVEIRILAHDHETVFPGVLPDRFVVGRFHAQQAHMRRSRIEILQGRYQTEGKILVEKKLQACL